MPRDIWLLEILAREPDGFHKVLGPNETGQGEKHFYYMDLNLQVLHIIISD
jgi:hypothetical protein